MDQKLAYNTETTDLGYDSLRSCETHLDFSDSPMNFGATSIIVPGLLRIQKADVDLLGPFAKKNFDFWWSGTLLPPCFVDQKVG